MTDRYMKILLTVIAINLTALVTLQALDLYVPEARAQEVVRVHVEGGRLDYATGGSFMRPTLKVCTDC